MTRELIVLDFDLKDGYSLVAVKGVYSDSSVFDYDIYIIYNNILVLNFYKFPNHKKTRLDFLNGYSDFLYIESLIEKIKNSFKIPDNCLYISKKDRMTMELRFNLIKNIL